MTFDLNFVHQITREEEVDKTSCVMIPALQSTTLHHVRVRVAYKFSPCLRTCKNNTSWPTLIMCSVQYDGVSRQVAVRDENDAPCPQQIRFLHRPLIGRPGGVSDTKAA